MAILHCQVCDHECDSVNTFQGAEEAQLWVSHTIQLVGAYVRVLTCPDCAEMPSPEILEGYQVRIKEGRDFRYH